MPYFSQRSSFSDDAIHTKNADANCSDQHSLQRHYDELSERKQYFYVCEVEVLISQVVDCKYVMVENVDDNPAQIVSKP